MTSAYETYKAKYENIKPIRGRSPEVRPIGERRRTHEQIVKRGDIYSVRLYNTDVVDYLPNGDVIVRTNGWHTPSTAEFIHEHSPFTCWKEGRVLWIRTRNKDGDVKAYPIGNELHMKYVGWGYEPATPVVIRKKVVDREKAKAARAPLQPFLQWVKTFLTLSDGWVMHETCKQALGWVCGPGEEQYARYPGYTGYERTLYERLTDPQGCLTPEEDYLYVLCCLSKMGVARLADRRAETISWQSESNMQGAARLLTHHRHFHDIQMDFNALRATMYRWVRKYEDIDKIVEVEPTNRAVSRPA